MHFLAQTFYSRRFHLASQGNREDWVVAMIDRFHFHERQVLLQTHATPLREGPLRLCLPRWYLSFNSYLSIGRNGQPRMFASKDLLRLPLEPPYKIEVFQSHVYQMRG